MAVPFADLQLQYQNIKGEIDGAIANVIRDNAFIRGPYVDAFEREFAAAAEVKHSVSCANGTDALYLAMAALKVRSGDEVITTAHSWISTSAMITHAGATPVFCDTDGTTFTIAPEAIEAAITERTVGIIPVHLYGQPADMDAIMAIARKHKLWVIEDCAQAHLARYKDQMIGTFGVAATYSFYPGKNLGAMGDAGALVTDDDGIADTLVALREHGQRAKYHHELDGYTARLDTMQAIVLRHKLPFLDEWNEQRREVARQFTERLADVGDLTLPNVPEGSEPVWHLYVVQTEAPVRLAEHLRDRGIGTGRHYPEPPHLSKAFSGLGYREGQFPVSERLASRCLSLPIFPGMTTDEAEAVVAGIGSFFDG